jgi:leucyl aminopeptidase
LEKNALFVPEEFSSNEVEAIVSGLLLGTYNLGHLKKDHPFKSWFWTRNLSSKDYTSTIDKAIKIAQLQTSASWLTTKQGNKVSANWALDKGKKYGFEVNT